MDKPTKKRLATDTLSSKEDMEVELNRKLPKRGTGSWIPVPVHSAPLIEDNVAPVEVQPTPAPTFDGMSNYPEGYNYGARYGGYQATRFNSTLVNDEEADARVEWNYHQRQPLAQTAGYMGAYSAPFPGPSARSQGFHAPYEDLDRERAKCPRPSTVLSALWDAWSVNRRQLLPLRQRLRRNFTRLSDRVSFFSFH
jgi:hypothetical protein